MFIQVIEGRVADAARVRARLDTWLEECAPGAVGWLGSTTGTTDDGRFVTLARFESEEAARRNSGRPEQDRWWAGTAELFAGDVTFRDSVDVLVDLVGDPDSAGFVQVMKGHVTDPVRARELMSQESAAWAAFRPDILGTVVILHEGGDYTMAVYFTSEEAAREGERKEAPAELAAQMAGMDALFTGTPEYLDLHDPWMPSKA